MVTALSLLLDEVEKATVERTEAAHIEVERPQIIVEVDMEDLAAGGGRLDSRSGNKADTDASSAC